MRKYVPKSKIIIILLVVIIALFIMLIAYSLLKDKHMINNTKDITKITVTTEPGGDKLKTTMDKDKIAEVVNYINGLDLRITSEDVSQYSGMSYIITIYFKHKSSKEYIHSGNNFFQQRGKKWYSMSYKQAIEFKSIYEGLEDN